MYLTTHQVGMTIAVSLPLVLIAFFVNDIGDYLSRLKSRRTIQDAPAHERREVANQTALDHKQKIPEKEQNRWKSLLRKRTTKQATVSNV
jgi:hypothetical protein